MFDEIKYFISIPLYVCVGMCSFFFFRKVASLDTEVYASGFTKDMEQDLQKEVSSQFFPTLSACVYGICACYLVIFTVPHL